VSFDLDEQDTREDIRRVAAACERSNELAAAHQRISADLRDLNLRRYEYERLQDGIFQERQRMQRHHDVLCLVLKELMRGNSPWPDNKRVSNFVEAVQMAEYAADLAYPPPKAEP
jgi:hypothetical protein